MSEVSLGIVFLILDVLDDVDPLDSNEEVVLIPPFDQGLDFDGVDVAMLQMRC